MIRILYEKEEIKLFCTYNRSANVYYGKFIFLLFQNKYFVMMYLIVSLDVVLKHEEPHLSG